MTHTHMEYIRAAIAQAVAEGLTAVDLQHCAEHAASPQGFCDAVNELADMQPYEDSSGG